MKRKLTEKLVLTPDSPGVYLMKDADGAVIYVGKARSLKKRLASYFRPTGSVDLKTGVLVGKIDTFDTILTANEKEALLLEETLIKRHRPRYNVVLKDDKRYPSLRFDITHPWPDLRIIRKTKNDGALYFGPFSSAHAVRSTLNLINKTFKLRKCKNREMQTRTRPCLHHQMQRCWAPCCLDVSPEAYRGVVQEVILFLKGRTPGLIREIRTQMKALADAFEFEKAAELRDKIFALEKTLERQVAVTNDFVDRDVLATVRADALGVVTVMRVRGGSLMGSQNYEIPPSLAMDTEVFSSFVRQYYRYSHRIPREILVPHLPEDAALLEDWLSEKKEKRVRMRWPRRGKKVLLIQLAEQNAQIALKEKIEAGKGAMALLGRLERRLKLKRLPRRIECFDNSNISGTAPVASQVVFVDGRAEKKSYRTYKIRTVYGPDDYASMAEVLRRRFSPDRTAPQPQPDLLLVDGGRGQLNIALAVLEEMALAGRFAVAGIAKKDEHRGEDQDRIYLPGRANPVNFGRDGDLLLFLQKIRDEAHRSAINFHRKRRTRSAMGSALDTIAGIGPKRKVLLLRHYGSIKKIRAASAEEMAGLPGMSRKAADAVRTALKENGRRGLT
jgi:excinuclease ABC subunit C